MCVFVCVCSCVCRCVDIVVHGRRRGRYAKRIVAASNQTIRQLDPGLDFEKAETALHRFASRIKSLTIVLRSGSF